MMKKCRVFKVAIMALTMMMLCMGCSTEDVTDIANNALEQYETAIPPHGGDNDERDSKAKTENQEEQEDKKNSSTTKAKTKNQEDKKNSTTEKNKTNKEDTDSENSLSNVLNGIPKYTGKAYTALNNNIPEFKKSDMKTKSYEKYGELDSLGRCTVAMANIGKDLMPTEERGAIGRVKPSGWHTVKYDCVDGKYLYNRCHLIGFQLTGENANERNLITGTRYMNVDGMLPFEDMVADYIKETSNHVLYRVTPKYAGKNLVASGVQMEAKSVEDNGDGICFNVFVFNVQPGVTIYYSTGESKLAGEGEGTVVKPTVKAYSDNNSNKTSKNNTSTKNNTTKNNTTNKNNTSTNQSSQKTKTYILNTNTKKYHNAGCRTISRMSDKNKKTYTGTTDSLEKQGYSACKICN